MIHVIGFMGNMGRRYCAILDFFKVDYIGTDIDDHAWPEAERVIIATPTDTHYSILKKFRDFKGKILCEKPITKCKEELEEIKSWNLNLSIVNQYRYLNSLSRIHALENTSFYDYFNSGKDGIVWDCISLVALAKGKITLSNKSPGWTCMLNGKEYLSQFMDDAYVMMIKEWLMDNHNVPIWEPHYKIFNFLEGKDESINLLTSKD
jgi:hypothetical protein